MYFCRWRISYKKEGEKHLPLLPSACTVLGKANLAQAVEFEGRGAKIQALNAYADARWAFLHIIAQFFDNDDYVASAHYFSGLCYDKLRDVEADAGEKAVREWKLVTTDFKKSDFNEPALKELERVGVKTAKEAAPAAAPKAAAPDKPAEGEKPPAKAPAKAPAKKKE